MSGFWKTDDARFRQAMVAGLILASLALEGACANEEKASNWKFRDGQWIGADAATSPGGGLPLAGHAKALLPIVVSNQARPPERTAAQQLAHYLGQISGASFRVIRESEHSPDAPAIFVGQTDALSRIGAISGKDLGPEEWRKKVLGQSLYLFGGFPRGALYAVFHLLEDELGVHWWTPEAETVPQRADLSVSREDRSGEPAFLARRVAYYYAAQRKSRDYFEGNRMVAAGKYDGGLFAARNRLNSEGNRDYHILWKYGGELRFGPPFSSHTYYLYVDPKIHFAKHPEWFSLVDGERRSELAQLDVMNPGLRAFFLSELLKNIQSTREEDAQTDGASRLYFDVSPNDHEGFDEGEASMRLVKSEGTQMAPLLDFVNYLAGAVSTEFPRVRLTTLAYKATKEPPRSMVAADNVVIRVTDTESNPVRPLSEDKNGKFLDLLKRWKSKASHLWVWDYANAYGITGGSLPVPFASAMFSDLRTYHHLGVEGVTVEVGSPWTGDNRDFLYWMILKGAENPGQDFATLEKTFTDGFYGPAGEFMRRYYALLRKAADSDQADGMIAFGSHLPAFAYLDLSFLREASALFDSAEAAVRKATNDDEALHRVRKARLGLDEAILRRYHHGLLSEWQADGGTESDFPLSIASVLKRYRETLLRTIRAAVLPQHIAAWTATIEDRILLLTPRERKPSDFPADAGDEVFDYLPDQMGWNSGFAPIQSTLTDPASGWKATARPVEDKTADAGVAMEVTLTNESNEARPSSEPHPFWTYFGLTEFKMVAGPMAMNKIGDTYRWIKLGVFSPVRRGLASLFSFEGKEMGAVWMNTDYYPELYSPGGATCAFWAKVRHIPNKSGSAVYRISRAAMVKKP